MDKVDHLVELVWTSQIICYLPYICLFASLLVCLAALIWSKEKGSLCGSNRLDTAGETL